MTINPSLPTKCRWIGGIIFFIGYGIEMARTNAVLDGPGFGILGSFSKVGSNVLSFGFILYIVSRIITFFPKFKFPSVSYTIPTYFLAFLLSFIVGRKLNFLSWKLACDSGTDGRGCSGYANAPLEHSEATKIMYAEKGMHLGDVASSKIAISINPDKYTLQVCQSFSKRCVSHPSQKNDFYFCEDLKDDCAKLPLDTPMDVVTAAKLGTLTIKRLGAYKGKVTELTPEGKSQAIHFAAEAGNVELMKLLFEKGAPLDPKSIDGHTPLITASCNNHLTSVEYLLSKGADVLIKANDGLTSLSCASAQGYLDIVKILVKHKADTKIKYYTKTPLELARSNKHTAVAEFLEKVSDL